jgi:FixJ family two-component response regulator
MAAGARRRVDKTPRASVNAPEGAPPLEDLATPTVFVVDDDSSVRTSLQRLFESVRLSCETYADAPAFLRRVAEDPLGCVVLDMRLPGTSGLEIQRQLLAAGCDLPIIFISGYIDVPLAVRAMKAGAREVLTKPFDDQTMIDAVHTALEAARRSRHRRQEVAAVRARFETLTSREREVMTLVVQGMLNKQIAGMLGTSEKTIKVHRGQVMHKMDADSVAALVRMADHLHPTRQE